MEYTLNLVFATSGGKNVTFSISDVKSDAQKVEIDANALMDLMIAKNVFTTSSGDLVSKVSASLVERKATKLTVA